MNQRTGLPAQRLFAAFPMVGLGLAVLFGSSACHTAPDTKVYAAQGWEHHRLPNSAKPYDKLLVEIDAVEGSEPTAGELADLKMYLEQLTNKPGGVTVKLDNIIARAKARGRTADSLALEYLNGPPDEQTAFLYILCYRGRLDPFFKPENPVFTIYPYPCAIFVNRSYAFGWFSWVSRGRELIMRHEVGHALGLARDESHSRGVHCTNEGCLMGPGLRFSFVRLLTFRPAFTNTELCADCRRDLENYRAADAAPGTRFWHGYFVRSGEGYQILTLPGIVYVHIGEFADLDADDIAGLRRDATEGIVERGQLKYRIDADLPEAAEGLRRFVENESGYKSLKMMAEDVLAWCLSQAEAARDSNPEKAREIAAATLPAAAKFPELQARLQALLDSLTVKAQGKAAADGAVK